MKKNTMKKNTMKNTGIKAALILTASLAFAAPAIGMIHPQNVMACDFETTNTQVMTVKVSDDYLALRSSASNDSSNEIGRLNDGDLVEANIDDLNAGKQFVQVYCASLDMSGYVNVDYLLETDAMTVKVNDGYLALRSACDDTTESVIGKLYNGETVLVCKSSDTNGSTYSKVYAPSLDKEGYVNNKYLTKATKADAKKAVDAKKAADAKKAKKADAKKADTKKTDTKKADKALEADLNGDIYEVGTKVVHSTDSNESIVLRLFSNGHAFCENKDGDFKQVADGEWQSEDGRLWTVEETEKIVSTLTLYSMDSDEVTVVKFANNGHNFNDQGLEFEAINGCEWRSSDGRFWSDSKAPKAADDQKKDSKEAAAPVTTEDVQPVTNKDTEDMTPVDTVNPEAATPASTEAATPASTEAAPAATEAATPATAEAPAEAAPEA